jgi:hypothetical protein
MQDLLRQIRNSAVIRSPVDTGLLRSSHRVAIRGTTKKLVGSVTNEVNYAAIVHGGRRGFGPIPPTKALRFKIGGRVIYRTRVGPARAQPWLRQAMIAVARKHRMRVISG